jgi:hypothetical protein
VKVSWLGRTASARIRKRHGSAPGSRTPGGSATRTTRFGGGESRDSGDGVQQKERAVVDRAQPSPSRSRPGNGGRPLEVTVHLAALRRDVVTIALGAEDTETLGFEHSATSDTRSGGPVTKAVGTNDNLPSKGTRPMEESGSGTGRAHIPLTGTGDSPEPTGGGHQRQLSRSTAACSASCSSLRFRTGATLATGHHRFPSPPTVKPLRDPEEQSDQSQVGTAAQPTPLRRRRRQPDGTHDRLAAWADGLAEGRVHQTALVVGVCRSCSRRPVPPQSATPPAIAEIDLTVGSHRRPRCTRWRRRRPKRHCRRNPYAAFAA